MTEYALTSGAAPVLAFPQGLSGDARAEAMAVLKLIAERGNMLRPPASKALGEGLFELRGRTSGVRIFYTFKPGRVVVPRSGLPATLLLDGLIKKRGDIPPRELERLRRLRKEAVS